jgi:hypothetical protein
MTPLADLNRSALALVLRDELGVIERIGIRQTGKSWSERHWTDSYRLEPLELPYGRRSSKTDIPGRIFSEICLLNTRPSDYLIDPQESQELFFGEGLTNVAVFP